MGIPTVGQNPSLSQRVWQYLKDEERILSSLTPKLILDRAFGKEETEKTIQEVYDVFLKTPGLPCLESEKVLLETVRQGVRTGLLGARIGSALYFGETPPDLTLDAVIVRAEKAEEEKKISIGKSIDTDGGFSGSYPDAGSGSKDDTLKDETIDSDKGRTQAVYVNEGSPGQAASAKVKRVSIKASVPWDKLSNVVTGVIRPLKACGSDPEITIEIKAETENGFDRTTLDSKVKETLQQLGSSIVEWEEG